MFDLLPMQRTKPISLLAILRGKSTNTVVFVIYHLSARRAQAISSCSFIVRQHSENLGSNKLQQWWLKWIIWNDFQRSCSLSLSLASRVILE